MSLCNNYIFYASLMYFYASKHVFLYLNVVFCIGVLYLSIIIMIVMYFMC